MRLQLFGSDGEKLSGETLVNETTANDQHRPAITVLGDGRLAVVWIDASHTAVERAPGVIHARLFGTGGGATDGNDLLAGTAGPDTIDALGGNDTLDGGAGSDILVGGAGRDRLTGGGGNDSLSGDAGNDRLIGGGGRDTLDGGAGNDVLTGGAARDHFVFAPGDGRTRITDFADNVDRLDLTAFGFASVAQAKQFAGNTAGDVVFEFATGDVLVVDDMAKGQLTGAVILV